MTADPPLSRVLRRLFQGIHLVVAVLFGSLLLAGVWNGLADIRPEKGLPAASVQVCVSDADRLRGELLDRLAAFPAAEAAAEEGTAFEKWSVKYRARLLDAKARCNPPAGASKAQAKALAKAFATITRTLDLSQIHATHWARHLGPSFDDATRAIKAAREAD